MRTGEARKNLSRRKSCTVQLTPPPGPHVLRGRACQAGASLPDGAACALACVPGYRLADDGMSASCVCEPGVAHSRRGPHVCVLRLAIVGGNAGTKSCLELLLRMDG